MTIVRWEPLREINSLQSEMNRLFNTFFDTPRRATGGTLRRWVPAMDLVETGDHFVLRADLPGLSEADVEIELEDGTLTVSGERKAEHEERERGLLPRRARLRRVPPLAHAAQGRRRATRSPRGSTTACSRSASRSPRRASRARSRSRAPARRRSRAATPRQRGQRSVRPPARRARGPATAALGSARRARFEIHAPRPRLARPRRHAAPRPRRGPHAGVRPAGDEGAWSRGSRPREVADARLRHGARQHVPPVPRRRATSWSRGCGGLHEFMRWDAPDHHRLRRLPGLLDGPRHGRRRDQGPRGAGARRAPARSSRSSEEGVRFRSYLDGSRALHGARDLDGGPGRARLRHRARVRRVHAVPRRPRLHRALDRAHAPLARPLPGLARRARARRTRSSTASSRAASTRTCGARRRRRSPRAARRDRDRRLARARTRRRCTRSSTGRPTSWRHASRAAPPARHRRRRRPHRAASSSGIDTFDCAMPTRLGRHGMAIVPDPEQPLARRPRRRAAAATRDEPIMEGCPCPACARGYTRGYLHYLLKRARADRRCGC